MSAKNSHSIAISFTVYALFTTETLRYWLANRRHTAVRAGKDFRSHLIFHGHFIGEGNDTQISLKQQGEP